MQPSVLNLAQPNIYVVRTTRGQNETVQCQGEWGGMRDTINTQF